MGSNLNFLKLLICIASSLFALHANGTESIPCKVLDPDIGLSYAGECKDGLAHGNGHAKGRDEYIGSFESGTAHGFGKYTWGKESEWAGEAYEGWHSRGDKHGYGIHSVQEGSNHPDLDYFKSDGVLQSDRFILRGVWWEGERLFLCKTESECAQILRQIPDLSNIETIRFNPSLLRYFSIEPNSNNKKLALLEAAINVKLQGKDNNKESIDLLNELGYFYKDAENYALAEVNFEKALNLRIETFGDGHLLVADSYNKIALINHLSYNYSKAEIFYNKSLSIYEKHPGESIKLSSVLLNIAGLYQEISQYDLAEKRYKRAIEIYQISNNLKSEIFAKTLNNLGTLYDILGRDNEAADLYTRVLEILEQLPDKEVEVASAIYNLAVLQRTIERYDLAENLYDRAIIIFESQKNELLLATSLSGMALTKQAKGDFEEAEKFHLKALSIIENKFGKDHIEIAIPLNNIATLFLQIGRFDKAEEIFLRAIDIKKKFYGNKNPSIANSWLNLGILYQSQKRYQAAEKAFDSAKRIYSENFGLAHIYLARSYGHISEVRLEQGKAIGALNASRSAISTYKTLIDRNRAWNIGQERLDGLEQNTFRNIDQLYRSREPFSSRTDESLRVIQLLQTTGTSAAITQMSARLAASSDAISQAVRQQQDLSTQIRSLDDRWINELGKPNAERNTVLIGNLRSQINDLKKQLASVDADIAQRFPEYQTLFRPEPLSVKHLQKLLKPAEALVTFAFDDKQGWLWVIRKNKAHWLPLTITQSEVTAMVKGIRQELDAAGTTLKLAEQPLHTLYQKLIGPAKLHLKDVRHLIIVPDGALQSLPFGLLATKPLPKIKRTQDYRQVDWLAKRYAISVLPAVSSLKALRHFTKEKPGEEPFAGFGDPLLGEGDGDVLPARGVLRKVSLQRGIANANDLRKQPRLPDTADELKALARTLNAANDALWLQDRATEGNVKKLSLKRYNTLAFATHGVLAGEITGTSEPGLILTPPWESSADEDGYLSAGEVALLKLNADWVLLSACNTAGADGTPGAEGLSGLAKAFFYAGARTLFVSHWKVDSGATVQLTTKTIAEHRKNPQAGKAEAHRKAMLALMNDPAHPEYADPFYWAPFVVVGEGGEVVYEILDAAS